MTTTTTTTTVTGMTTTTSTEPALLHLLWLASPALPVGGFSYSEGLEAAVRLSHRYIPARQLPDKAVSLLDTAVIINDPQCVNKTFPTYFEVLAGLQE